MAAEKTVDIVFAVVTVAVFAGLTIVTVASAASSGVAGLGI